MERIKRLNALGMNLIGASDELKNYTKEIIKDCSSIAFGLYRGETDAITADRTQTLIREARWRLDMLQKRLDTVLVESGVDVVEQMTMDSEENNPIN